MDGKNELFQRLKRECVALAQTAASYKSGRSEQTNVVESLDKLYQTLASATSKKQDAFDAKLAEYAFFPIAQLLRESQTLSIRCLELCLQCIATLIDKGWKRDLPPKLAAQLVILCSNLGEKAPRGLSFPQTTDELQSWSFQCLYHVFSWAAANDESKGALTDESAFPQLGQTISVLLDGIYDGKSIEPQIAGTMALNALVVNVIEAEVQANFLPGLVSSLTKILTPQTKQRRNHKVLIGCLDTFAVLLKNTLSNAQLQEHGNGATPHLRQKSIMDAQWKVAAASQLKPAINNILRLKSHAREDVKESLARFCLALLRDCRQTLSNCNSIALEALITIASGWQNKAITYDIQSLLQADRPLTELMQTMLYDWLRRLAIIMQGSDEEAKAATAAHVSTAYTLLADAGADMTSIDRPLTIAIRDSAAVTLAGPSTQQQANLSSSPIQAVDLSVLNSGGIGSSRRHSQLVNHRGQETSLKRLEDIVKLAVRYQQSSDFGEGLIRDLQHSTGDTQIANFWLLLCSIEAAIKQGQSTDDLLDLGDDAGSTHHGALDELYAFSLSTLTVPSEEPKDPRLMSLALHGLSLRAQTAGEDFRYELVDALYPVLHTLATPKDQLQRDSISTLNIFTLACGYASTKTLVVENVDYLTNAVALKLNAFDVSPQAPQVLLMMVRLAGPSLLPYLEDTVESIFAALEDYHGYPLLVELLFKVLGAMAEEGTKAPQLAIESREKGDETPTKSDAWQPTSMEALIALMKRDAAKDENSSDRKEPLEPHPQRPWKKDQETEKADSDFDALDEYQDQQVDDTDPPRPIPKTYNLLFKITELTQHFLPSASPSLRTSLLSLIKTTVPAIARHENSFLPLINTLWPEIVARLDDEEPYAVASAIEVMGVLCEYAGDFMRTRVDQVWPRLMELCPAVVKKSAPAQGSKTDVRSKSTSYDSSLSLDMSRHMDLSGIFTAPTSQSNTSNRLIWDALVPAVTRIVRFTQVSPARFDEALLMLKPALEQAGVRQALQEINADALWLAEVKCGRVVEPKLPTVPANKSWAFAWVSG